MGANDAAEMLEAAKAECVRLERIITTIVEEVRGIPCYGKRGQSEFDIPGHSHRETVLHTIQSAIANGVNQ